MEENPRFQPCPECQSIEHIRLVINLVIQEWSTACHRCYVFCDKDNYRGYGRTVKESVDQWNERTLFANTHDAREVLIRREKNRLADIEKFEQRAAEVTPWRS